MHVYDVDGDGDNDVITSLQAHGFGLAWFEQTKDGAVSCSSKKHQITGASPEKTAMVSSSRNSMPSTWSIWMGTA
ncbi:MAG: hypothetical protein U0935_23470 [Pirellulales bacterium]